MHIIVIVLLWGTITIYLSLNQILIKRKEGVIMRTNYFQEKIWRAKAAEDWYKRMDIQASDDTKTSVALSKIYPETFSNIRDIEDNSSLPIKDRILFIPMTTENAIFKFTNQYKSRKICALNFASYKHPGGMFFNGSSAQEESLCHVSNLYNILENFKKDFYIPNKARLNNSLYNSNLIYIPDVMFFNPSDDYNSCRCDIITCAAPNRKAAKKYHNVSDNAILEALIDRCYHVLLAAATNDADILILGAFGCGVFGNKSYEVAFIFGVLLNTVFKNMIKEVVFAIPEMNWHDRTLFVFESVIGEISKDKHSKKYGYIEGMIKKYDK